MCKINTLENEKEKIKLDAIKDATKTIGEIRGSMRNIKSMNNYGKH